MKKLLIAACILLGSLFTRSQPLEDLIEDVRAHKTSITGLRALFSKHPSYTDETNYFRGYNAALLGQWVQKAEFHYTLADSITRYMTIQVICKKEQVGYIKIEGMRYDSIQKKETWQVAYTYVDTAYTNQVLAGYNKKHKTQFTCKDLYEDDLDEFVVFPGFRTPNLLRDSNGVVIGLGPDEPFLSGYMEHYLPLIKKRDHGAIIKMCKSLNPARRAYGALCLYTLQKLKVSLSAEEKQLIENISHSNEITNYSPGGCYSAQPKKINTFLTKRNLNRYAEVVIEEGHLTNN